MSRSELRGIEVGKRKRCKTEEVGPSLKRNRKCRVKMIERERERENSEEIMQLDVTKIDLKAKLSDLIDIR